MDRQNIKNCFYFQMGRGQILRDREYTEILRNLERKRHWKKIYWKILLDSVEKNLRVQ